jgi:transcriptional regulator with XRE-family HTH domain
MDVKIDTRRVTAEREKRAWSQQHLADASGLALRTIQRIEASGSASYESAQALAACFGVAVADLRASEEPEQRSNGRSRTAKISGSVAAGSLLALAAAVFLRTAFAADVLVDVAVTVDEDAAQNVRHFRTQFRIDSGEPMDLPMEDQFSLVIVPQALEDGNVLLAVKLYEQRDNGSTLLGEPRMITPDGTETEVTFPIESLKRTYRIAIKPRID